MKTKDIIVKRLRDNGLRVTPQRMVILEILSEVEGHHHLSAQEVFALAQDRMPGLNTATVYRSLEDLTQAGLTEQMVTPADAVRFSLKNPEHQHCHLSCRSCHEVLEFSPEVMGEVAHTLTERHGFAIDLGHLTLVGLCSKCASTPASPPHHHTHG